MTGYLDGNLKDAVGNCVMNGWRPASSRFKQDKVQKLQRREKWRTHKLEERAEIQRPKQLLDKKEVGGR